jgi:hypothetical protein
MEIRESIHTSFKNIENESLQSNWQKIYFKNNAKSFDHAGMRL